MPDLAARPEALLQTRLQQVRQRIRQACLEAGRPADSARLLAVSKTFDADIMRLARQLGVREFGESYLQEALPKIEALGRDDLVWHFIGPIQSNKTRDLAAHFDWVQGVDRIKIAQRLSDQRPDMLPPLSICVQVNISDEGSKSGCAPSEAVDLCRELATLPRLRLRGLMTIPAPESAGQDPRQAYAALRELHLQVKSALPNGSYDFDTISAGMSDDLEAAIAEGSTLVRVGSALFGER